MNDVILVTGGAGFIGSCFVRQALSQTPATIVNLDKLTYAGNPLAIPSPDPKRYHFYQGDIADFNFVQQIVEKHQPKAVIHFAAESHVDRSIDGPRAFVETNVVGTFELLMVSLKYWGSLAGGDREAFRFLHVSTDEVYGSLGDTGKFTEQTSYDPHSPYSASKAASDHFVRAFHHTYGLPTMVTNCSNNYGPYQFPEKLIPLVTLNALDGKSLPVYGKGQNVRDWLYVEDHCNALRTVLDRGVPGETYNIGGNSERSNLQVVQSICEIIDSLGLTHHGSSSRDLITFVTDRPGHDFRYAIDAEKIRRELGWSPSKSFEQGLKETIQWYVENRTWLEESIKGRYDRQRLGVRQAN